MSQPFASETGAMTLAPAATAFRKTEASSPSPSGPAFRVIAYPTARGCAAAYFPETNVLVPLDHTAEVSNTPAAKSIIVRLDAGS